MTKATSKRRAAKPRASKPRRPKHRQPWSSLETTLRVLFGMILHHIVVLTLGLPPNTGLLVSAAVATCLGLAMGWLRKV